jgi:hypothetical protein
MVCTRTCPTQTVAQLSPCTPSRNSEMSNLAMSPSYIDTPQITLDYEGRWKGGCCLDSTFGLPFVSLSDKAMTYLELPVVGDAVYDHLIDRGADGLGEAAVVQGGWVGPMLHDRLDTESKAISVPPSMQQLYAILVLAVGFCCL